MWMKKQLQMKIHKEWMKKKSKLSEYPKLKKILISLPCVYKR
jgi:hypothetical protein